MARFRNGAGYPDPSAEKAFASMSREQRHKELLARIEDTESYEQLCRQFRSMAEERGFEFPGQIWLKNIKSGKILKRG